MTTLLIVDDDQTNRMRLAMIVRSLEYNALFASDGSRALNMLEDNPGIDIVITDWQMPIMDGPALIRALREAGNHLPVLVYSAFRSVSELTGLLRQGADYFLPYPVSREDLVEYVARFKIRPKENSVTAQTFRRGMPAGPFSPG